MTDLQDAILDRLVGAKVGVNWPDGPLTLAAKVVGGTKPIVFGLTDNDRGPKAEIAKRLGYPVLLIEAIQGGNRGFAAEDERRAFAMAVFRRVSVGGKPPRLSSREQNRIAGGLAVRAHAYLCPSKRCAALRALKALLDAPKPTVNQVAAAVYTACKTTKAAVCTSAKATANATSVERLASAANMAVTAVERGSSWHGWCSARESVRVAASEGGLEEAIDCCVEIARQCGVPVVG